MLSPYAISILLVLVLLSCVVHCTIVVHLASVPEVQQTHLGSDPIQKVRYCLNCTNPESTGSFVFGILVKHRVKNYKVTSELIYGVPNHGDGKRLLNQGELDGRIVFLQRGRVPLREKALRVQEAGGLGLVVADTGQCDEEFSFCGPHFGSKAEGGLSPADSASEWKHITIPVVLLSLKTANRLRSQMVIKQQQIPRMEVQNITIVDYVRDIGVEDYYDPYDEL